MRVFLLLLLLPLAAAAQTPAPPADPAAPLPVLAFKWSKSARLLPKGEPTTTGPAAALTAADRNYERGRRSNDPTGVRYPTSDTIDNRSAAIEKNVQESRASSRGPTQVYEYHAKVRNDFAKQAEIVFWEYQFAEPAKPENVTRRQFLCGVNIKPGKEKELLALSASPPSTVVSAGSLSQSAGETYIEKAVVNRVEYSDGTIWQRKGWSFAEVRAALARATSTPWGPEMCRGL